MRVAVLLITALSAFATVASAESPQWWFESGQSVITARQADNAPPAKNVILFVGDGMSLTTVSAARILQGQQQGQSGEENLLFFETFKHLALAKTYNTDQQTPDSAGTMTAMATGIKSYAGSIAVSPEVPRGDCAASQGQELVSLLDLAALGGLATGIVSTTRITHATPAVLYAKAADRRWESDRGLPPSAQAAGCRDIADQLISYDVGRGLDIVLGGGRRAFYPAESQDPEHPEITGHRSDGRDLIAEWQTRHPNGQFVWNQAGFDALDTDADGPILGLFEPGHMQYEFDRPKDPAGEPALREMVDQAIEVLSKRSEDGFLLVVESGRIDHAHHANNARRALTDTIAFAEAIEHASRQTNPDETLIIVTADHAHALTFDGYGARGNPIMGYAVRPGDGDPAERTMRDHKDQPMTVLNYANGPGYRRDDAKIDFRNMDPLDPDYKQKAGTWQYSATHAGEDVPVYSTGPGAQVLYGVLEQNTLYHAIIAAQPALEETQSSLKGNQSWPQWSVLRASQAD
ncbi:MAG: alkaline phosphatase [Wenzhouxiangella sp.]|nr:alkaline phosphatase [Wenzhouxiangella sp.]